MIPAPQPPGMIPQVQAVYTFEATVETQLSFKEGDILALMGEKSEGWQYGQNTRTGRYLKSLHAFLFPVIKFNIGGKLLLRNNPESPILFIFNIS